MSKKSEQKVNSKVTNVMEIAKTLDTPIVETKGQGLSMKGEASKLTPEPLKLSRYILI